MSDSVPPEPRNLTTGMQVEAAFRLFDVLPFAVRFDISRLIYLYLHDPGGYMSRRPRLGVCNCGPPGPLVADPERPDVRCERCGLPGIAGKEPPP